MEQVDPRAALDALVAGNGESYAALSRLIGRNAAYLQQFVRRGTPRLLAERDRRLLAGYFGIEESVLGAAAGSGGSATMIRVPRIDAAASAGPGGLVEDDRQTGTGGFDPALLKRLGVHPVDLSVIRAQGDSMLPTIADGDEILVDRSDRRVPPRGGVYVIRRDGVLMVKRVTRMSKDLAIASDNPAAAPVSSAGIEIVGRVVWLSRALK